MLKYIILAEICLTVGTPDWVVTLCWIGFGLSICKTIFKNWIQKFLKNDNFKEEVKR